MRVKHELIAKLKMASGTTEASDCQTRQWDTACDKALLPGSLFAQGGCGEKRLYSQATVGSNVPSIQPNC